MAVTGTAGFAWYAIQYPQLRTGRTLIEYVYASSAQQAAETQAGATLLGGPYNSQAAAEAAHPQGSSGSTPAYQGAGGSQASAPSQSDQPVNPLAGLSSIGDFFGRLEEASTWIRVGEVVLGLVLIAVGVARITHAVPIATKIATTVGAVAV